MTCARCNHGFCWRCLKSWKPSHKDYYNCSAMVRGWAHGVRDPTAAAVGPRAELYASNNGIAARAKQWGETGASEAEVLGTLY